MRLEKGVSFTTHLEVALLLYFLLMMPLRSLLRSQADTRASLAVDNHRLPPTIQTWVLECPLLPLASSEKMLICSVLFILGRLKLGSMSHSSVYPQGLVYNPHQIFVE